MEKFFSGLPAPLFKQGVLLKNNLATFYSDTGQFKDILSRQHDFPLLYLHFWLLDDFGVAENSARAEMEKRLFLAMLFTFAAVYTQDSILDDGSNFDNSYLFLAHALTRQADRHLAQLFPASSEFWSHHQHFWHQYSEAVLATANHRRLTADSVASTPGFGKLAFSKVPVTAVAINAGQEAALPQLWTMMDQLNAVFQIIRDVSTLRLDLVRRRYTYPILKTMDKAGIDPHWSPPPEQILGALVLTGTIQDIEGECLEYLKNCREISTLLNLPAFIAYWPVVEDLITDIATLFNIRAKPVQSSSTSKRPFFAPAVDPLPKVTDMAEGYLLADLSFKESWEVQRRGIFGEAEVTGKAFPMGLIAEILARHGHDMSAPINDVFTTLQAAGFRYYNHPHLPPDSDDVALLLRLYRFAAEPEKYRALLQTPLQWLAAAIDDSGAIPVWLMPGQPAEQAGFVSLWGQSCAAVEANVLLGLIAYDWAGYRQQVETSALNLFERWLKEGLAATHHYIPLYSLWVTVELAAQLSSLPISDALQDKLSQIIPSLIKYLTTESRRAVVSPQDAAFLTLIYHSKEMPESVQSDFNPEWLTILAKHQRYDGSWAGEPLFGTPTRGELAAWYSSRLVTTAFCYHALKVSASHQGYV